MPQLSMLRGSAHQSNCSLTLDSQQEKFKLGLDFPNVPYLICGDIKLTQSMAILRFLARLGGLFPKTEEGQRRADMVEQQVKWSYFVLRIAHSILDRWNPSLFMG